MSYTAIVKNLCPSGQWIRLFTSEPEDRFKGYAIAAGEQQEYCVDNGPIRSVRGFSWEEGEPEIWKPVYRVALEDSYRQRLVLTPVFGPRPGASIKVYMACLAGPADPTTRNDIALIDKFCEFGVPRENVWMFLERQCTPDVIYPTLKQCADDCAEDDFLFVYLGGHGSGGDAYCLATWHGSTTGPRVLKQLHQCKARNAFIVVDSCYSGQFIVDLRRYVRENPEALPARVDVLTSVQADRSARTGWKLIQMLIDGLFTGGYTTAEAVGRHVADTLRTSSAEQRAQFFTYIRK